MNEEIEKLFQDMGDGTKKGVQARQVLGIIFYYRIQQTMDSAEKLIIHQQINEMPHVFAMFDSVFRTVRGMLNDDEIKDLEDIRKKCKTDIVSLKKRMTQAHSKRKHLIAPETLIPNIEQYDMVLNDALNKHNLNIPLRNPNMDSMSVE